MIVVCMSAVLKNYLICPFLIQHPGPSMIFMLLLLNFIMNRFVFIYFPYLPFFHLFDYFFSCNSSVDSRYCFNHVFLCIFKIKLMILIMLCFIQKSRFVICY